MTEVQQMHIIKSLYDSVATDILPAVVRATSGWYQNILASHVLRNTIQCVESVSVSVHMSYDATKLFDQQLRLHPCTDAFHGDLNSANLTLIFDTIGMNICRLLCAVLAQDRVVVIGRNLNASIPARAVMGISSLFSAFDQQFCDRCIFPYASVTTSAYFKAVPGYVIGTVNPLFEMAKGPSAWYDTLIDMETRTVTVAGHATQSQRLYERYEATHRRFAKNAISHITENRASHHLDRVQIEHCLRYMCAHHIAAILSQESRASEPIPNVILSSFFDNFRSAGTVLRAFSIAPTHAENLHDKCFWWCDDIRKIQSTEETFLVSLLQNGLELVTGDNACEEAIDILLLNFPSALGALQPLAQLLFHPSPRVVLFTFNLLSRIDNFPRGRQAINQLNGFVLFLYEQLKNENAHGIAPGHQC